MGSDPYSLGEFVVEVPDNIQWLSTVVGGEQVGILGKENVISVDSIESVDPYTIADESNRPGNLPLGLISFNVEVDRPGDIAEVTIYLSNPADIKAAWHKYDPLNGWQDYSEYSSFSADRMSVTLELKDGGYGDADGRQNGIIVDPSGLGSAASSGSGGGGGGGGCFIATAAYGSQVERHVMLLRKFRDRYLLTNRVGKDFVTCYYTYSPPVADYITKHGVLRVAARWSLLPLVGFSWLTLQLGPLASLALTLLLLAFISIPALFLIRRIHSG